MKITLGTTSKAKERYAREVLSEIGLGDPDIELFEVQSGVSDQPMTSAETKRGAENRARAALAAVPGADIGIGIEVGYDEETPGSYSIFAWAVIADRRGLTTFRSHAFPLPRFHNECLRRGDYLSDKVREYVTLARTDIGRKLGMLIVDRDTVIKTALYHCLLIYFNKEEF